MSRPIGIVLLAAGSSSRMGQSKQLLPIKGEPLLVRSARAALSSGAASIVVVLGADAESIRKAVLKLPISVVINPDWKKGMGSSLKTGLRLLLHLAPETAAALIMVCDQPKITSDHLDNLMSHYDRYKNPVVASAYANTLGVPALFDQSLFAELLSLGDEEGARLIIRRHAESCAAVPFANGETDLDTPEDFQKFLHP